MRCIDCEHFKDVQKPMMPWDTGRCICEKYELHCDYVSKQHLSRLECVEDDDMTFAQVMGRPVEVQE